MAHRLLYLLLGLCVTAANAQPIHIPIDVYTSPQSSAESWPVTVGVPFAQGVAPNAAQLSLINGKGQAEPCQVTALEAWPDGSVRWAWVDFISQPDANYAIVEGHPTQPAQAIKVNEANNRITIDTGAAQYVFDGGGCFTTIQIGGRAITNGAGDGFYVIDSKGRRGILKPTEVKVELKGPLRTVLRVAGEYKTDDGSRNAGAIVYYHFYAGRPEVRIEHKLIVTENTNELWFRDIGLTLPLSQVDHRQAAVTFAGDDNYNVGNTPVTLLQKTYPHFGKHESQCVLLRGNEIISKRDVAGDWVAVGGVAIQVPAFAQTFPKAFVAEHGQLTVKLWAPEAGQELDFRTEKVLDWYFGKDWIPPDNKAWTLSNNAQGTSRTHDIWLYPHLGKLDTRKLGANEQPTFAKVDPTWVAKSGVMGPVHPYDPQQYPEAERAMAEMFDRTVGFSETLFPNNGYLYHRAYPWCSQGWEVKGQTAEGSTTSGGTSGGGQWYPQIHRLSRSLDYNFKRHIWIAAMRHPDRRYYDYARDYTKFQHDMLWSNAETEGRDTRGKLYQAYFHSPIVWAGRGAYLSWASSEDVIQFVYDYFFDGSYHSRDMVEAWIEQLKKQYGEDAAAAAEKQDRSDSLLRMIGSAYELHHDPWLLKFSHAFLKHTVKPDNEVGLDLAPSQIAKTGDVYSSYFYNWVHTRDPLALVPLKRFAEFDYRRGLLKFDTRSSAMPYAYTVKYLDDGDEGFANMLAAWMHQRSEGSPTIEEMGIDRDAIKPGYTGDFGKVILTASGPTFYGLPMAMAVAQRGNIMPKPSPIVEQPHPTQRVYLLLNRTVAREDTLDLFVNDFGSRGHALTLRDANGTSATMDVIERDEHRVTKPPGVKGVQAFKQYYLMSGSLIYYRLKIPANVPAGVYHLDVGEQVSFKLLSSTIEDAILSAPDGVVIRDGHRYYFPIASGHEAVTAFSHRPVVIEDASGKPVEQTEPNAVTGVFTFKTNGSGVYSVHSVGDKYMHKTITGSDTFFRLHDVPLVLAKDDPSRLFEVETARYPSSEPAGVRVAPDDGMAFVDKGKFGSSVLLNYRVIALPTDAESSAAPHGKGTAEFWWRPRWSAGDFNMAQSTQRLYLFHMDPVGLSYFIDCPNSGRTAYYNDSKLFMYLFKPGHTRAMFYPTAGQWYHVAATWNVDGEDSQVDLYINGRKMSYAHYYEGMLRDTPLSELNPIGDMLRLGSARFAGKAQGGDEFDELRVSRTVRYTQDFEPPSKAFVPDSDTWMLMHFDGDLKAMRGGEVIEAQVDAKRRLY